MNIGSLVRFKHTVVNDPKFIKCLRIQYHRLYERTYITGKRSDDCVEAILQRKDLTVASNTSAGVRLNFRNKPMGITFNPEFLEKVE